MNKQSQKIERRNRRSTRVRSIVSGSAERPRLAVFRANQNIYAQLIDDVSGKTLAQASTLKSKGAAKTDSKAAKSSAGGNKTDSAAAVGKAIAEKAIELKIKAVVFDRGGFKYHGRVKALAEAAREVGLQF